MKYTIDGKLTVDNYEQHRVKILQIVESSKTPVEIEFTDEHAYIDSSGVGLLIKVSIWNENKFGLHKKTSITGLSENMRNMFRLARLDLRFEI